MPEQAYMDNVDLLPINDVVTRPAAVVLHPGKLHYSDHRFLSAIVPAVTLRMPRIVRRCRQISLQASNPTPSPGPTFPRQEFPHLPSCSRRRRGRKYYRRDQVLGPC